MMMVDFMFQLIVSFVMPCMALDGFEHVCDTYFVMLQGQN
jgi:hypothetical protein